MTDDGLFTRKFIRNYRMSEVIPEREACVKLTRVVFESCMKRVDTSSWLYSLAVSNSGIKMNTCITLVI